MSAVALGPHYDELVRRLVDAGRYAYPDEVMKDGLRLLEESEARLGALRRHIADGLASGPSEPMDMDAIRSEARVMRKHGTARIA